MSIDIFLELMSTSLSFRSGFRSSRSRSQSSNVHDCTLVVTGVPGVTFEGLYPLPWIFGPMSLMEVALSPHLVTLPCVMYPGRESSPKSPTRVTCKYVKGVAPCVHSIGYYEAFPSCIYRGSPSSLLLPMTRWHLNHCRCSILLHTSRCVVT